MLGTEPLESRYRIWYVDHAMHTGTNRCPEWPSPTPPPRANAAMVSYLGVLQQALRNLANWVEHDVVPPPAPTSSSSTAIRLPSTAKARKGVQRWST